MKLIRNLVVAGVVCGLLAGGYGASIPLIYAAVLGGLYIGAVYSIKTRVA